MSCETLIVRGKVFSSVGEGRKFVSLPWFRKQVEEIFGFKPYPGTLNLLLADKDGENLAHLLKNKHGGHHVFPENGYFPGFLYKALIASKILGAVVRPSVPNYPKNVLELIASICLRKILKIKDGDEIEVEIWIG